MLVFSRCSCFCGYDINVVHRYNLSTYISVSAPSLRRQCWNFIWEICLVVEFSKGVKIIPGSRTFWKKCTFSLKIGHVGLELQLGYGFKYHRLRTRFQNCLELVLAPQKKLFTDCKKVGGIDQTQHELWPFFFGKSTTMEETSIVWSYPRDFLFSPPKLCVW